MEHIVAHFGKALNLERLGQTEETPSGQEGSALKETLLGKWFVLGYFDTLEIYVPYQREKDSWLSSMFTHNVELSKRLDGNFYYHPLHLFDMASGEAERFLGRDDVQPNRPYLFVTLVQSAAPPPWKADLQRKATKGHRRDNRKQQSGNVYVLPDTGAERFSGTIALRQLVQPDRNSPRYLFAT